MLLMSCFEKPMHLHIRCYLSRRKSAMKTVTQEKASAERAPVLNYEHSFYSLSTNTNYSPCSAATFLKFGHLFSTGRRRRWLPDAVCIRAKCPSCHFKIFSAKRTLTSSKRETHPLSVGRSGRGDSPHRPHSCVHFPNGGGWAD